MLSHPIEHAFEYFHMTYLDRIKHPSWALSVLFTKTLQQKSTTALKQRNEQGVKTYYLDFSYFHTKVEGTRYGVVELCEKW